MSTMSRLRIAWSGSSVVGGGLTTMYFGALADPTVITPAVKTFFDSLKSYVPTGVTWNIPNGGDIIDVPTGGLVGAWTGGGAFTVVGTSASSYTAGAGGRFNLSTTGIANRRRVRGSLFFCPISGTYYDSDGSLANTFVTAANTAAATLLATASLDLSVWHRPKPKGASNGDIFHVSSMTMPDNVSWLRTRRT